MGRSDRDRYRGGVGIGFVMRPHVSAGVAPVVRDVALFAEVEQASSLVTEWTEVIRHTAHQGEAASYLVSVEGVCSLLNTNPVELLDEPRPAATGLQPKGRDGEWKVAVSAYGSVVTLIFATWNQIVPWLRRIDQLRAA